MELVCLITGCSHPTGFGALSALALRERGHRVYATMRDPAGRNREPAGELRRYVEVLELDVTDEGSVQATVEAILERDGRIDALVNNAAAVPAASLEETPIESLRRTLDANVLGPHRLALATLPQMRERGAGVIVQISSVNGFYVEPLIGAYCASKFALEAYSEALAYEVGHFGIRIVIIEPGPYATGVHDRVAWEPKSLDPASPYEPLKRQTWGGGPAEWGNDALADPMEVVDAIVSAVEDPTTPLHAPVGTVARKIRERFRPLPDVAIKAEIWGEYSLDW